ncbi:MAG: hypothetical protein SFT91_06410 [Rickettsiaceae bacterium]|nr:hypothetical protein [Rickettsiaceae bacterium]
MGTKGDTHEHIIKRTKDIEYQVSKVLTDGVSGSIYLPLVYISVSENGWVFIEYGRENGQGNQYGLVGLRNRFIRIIKA